MMALGKMTENRPKYLNLFNIRLPLNALVSILHRISGVLLFLLIPLMLWGMQTSIHSAEGFAKVGELLAHPLSKFIVAFIATCFFHHFFAGLRHLAMDVHIGTNINHARLSGRIVLIAGVAMGLVTLWWIW